MMRRWKLALVALTLGAPLAVSAARAEPAAQPSPPDAKSTHAETTKHPRKHTRPGDDVNRGASTSRRSDDPTHGRNTGDAKLSGPGSGAGL